MKGPSEKTPHDKKTNGTASKGRIKGINTGKIISEAQHIVSTAVGVLEKEVAAGIVAAKKLEKKFIDVDEIRNNDPTALMSRIRQDAYAVVDLLLDAVNIAVKQLDSLSENLDKAQKPFVTPKPAAHIPVVKNENAAKAGSSIEVSFLLRNDSIDTSMAVELHKPDLSDPKGKKILARHIQFIPDSVILKPGEEKAVTIKVSVPKSAGPGAYSGLFQDKNNAQLCAVLIITVE